MLEYSYNIPIILLYIPIYSYNILTIFLWYTGKLDINNPTRRIANIYTYQMQRKPIRPPELRCTTSFWSLWCILCTRRPMPETVHNKWVQCSCIFSWCGALTYCIVLCIILGNIQHGMVESRDSRHRRVSAQYMKYTSDTPGVWPVCLRMVQYF